jgi:hypothetical protein
MFRMGPASGIVFGILLVAGVARAEDLLPGLEVRAWRDLALPLDPPPGTLPIDGAMFDLVSPSPVPDGSTAAGTIGYMTMPIHIDGGVGELFARVGGFSSQTGFLDRFAVEYRGKLSVPVDGDYRFSTTSDDGSALWIDPPSVNPPYDSAVVQNNYPQAMVLRTSGVIPLTAGTHDLIIRSNQNLGGSGLFVQWDPSGGTNFVDIPGTQFSHVSVPEPSTLALLVVGAVGMMGYAWRRRKR